MAPYGFDDKSWWEEAKKEAKVILAKIAKNRGRIPYSELVTQISAIQMEADDPRLANFLDQISTEEDRDGRGMLTAIVVHKYGDMQPGPGFFELAKRLGRDTSDILRCWVNEFNKVHDYWANKDRG